MEVGKGKIFHRKGFVFNGAIPSDLICSMLNMQCTVGCVEWNFPWYFAVISGCWSSWEIKMRKFQLRVKTLLQHCSHTPQKYPPISTRLICTRVGQIVDS